MKPQPKTRQIHLTAACLSAFVLAFAPPALAQHDHHTATPAQAANNTKPPIASGQGVVKKIDHEKQRLTLAHGPITTLGWPAMTMPFTVSDPALLQGLKVDDTVEFDLKDEETINAIRRR
jgi:Cu(I)/Ag(I) efflux system protein CusF